MNAPRIAIVLPCYNEQEVLPTTARTLLDLLDRFSADGLVAPDSYILCSNDGSRDATRRIIADLHAADPRLKGITLAHNRGQQPALLAGLMTVRDHCDAAITIDADLQDNPEMMREMIELFRRGTDIVYGVRSSRDTDSWFKRVTAQSFYRFQNAMGLQTIYNHADYRLMSRRALDILSQYGESNLYLRGIMPDIGLSTAVVEYARTERTAGESKYPLSKMIALSIDGITSFTAKPMRIIFLVGLCLMVVDIMVALWVLYVHMAHHTVSGWSSLMLSVWFLGSLILMAIGIVGEYIGKIFVEVKHRPRYNIEEKIF
ncbi:MAG: glycosyltransferase family 2 protein [Muribaculaceae bacterium]|nr:glycosyltransferase family 2 protein [Muribaculaceae bacterium]